MRAAAGRSRGDSCARGVGRRGGRCRQWGVCWSWCGAGGRRARGGWDGWGCVDRGAVRRLWVSMWRTEGGRGAARGLALCCAANGGAQGDARSSGVFQPIVGFSFFLVRAGRAEPALVRARGHISVSSTIVCRRDVLGARRCRAWQGSARASGWARPVRGKRARARAGGGRKAVLATHVAAEADAQGERGIYLCFL